MNISPINMANSSYLPQTQKQNTIPFKAETNPQTGNDAKAAKNFAILATLGSVGSLVVSGLMLKKANAISKEVEAAKPLTEKISKIIEETEPAIKKITEFSENAEPIIEDLRAPLEKLTNMVKFTDEIFDDTGLDKLVEYFSQLFKTTLTGFADNIKNIAPTMDKIAKEENPEKLEKLNEELIKKMTKSMMKITKDLDKTQVKDIDDAPFAKVLNGVMSGNLDLKKIITNIFTEEQIANNPQIQKILKSLEYIKTKTKVNTNLN